MFEYSHVVTLGDLIVAIALVLVCVVAIWMYRDYRRRQELAEIERGRLRSNRLVSKLLDKQQNIGNRFANAIRPISQKLGQSLSINPCESGVGGYEIAVATSGNNPVFHVNVDLFRSPGKAILISCGDSKLRGWYSADDAIVTGLINDLVAWSRATYSGEVVK